MPFNLKTVAWLVRSRYLFPHSANICLLVRVLNSLRFNVIIEMMLFAYTILLLVFYVPYVAFSLYFSIIAIFCVSFILCIIEISVCFLTFFYLWATTSVADLWLIINIWFKTIECISTNLISTACKTLTQKNLVFSSFLVVLLSYKVHLYTSQAYQKSIIIIVLCLLKNRYKERITNKSLYYISVFIYIVTF